MALFTDGVISGLEDLSAQDSGILDLANAEGMDLLVKMRLAQEEIGLELTGMLSRGRWSGLVSVPPTGLENVAVTAPLRLWHTFQTLAISYRDAYNNQLNDRYQGKWKQYKDLATWAMGRLMQLGVGLVTNPIPRPPQPALTYVAGLQPGGTFYVSITWSGDNNTEGAGSERREILVPPANLLSVGPPPTSVKRRGWNVYVGSEPERLYKQNPAGPLDLAFAWVQTGPMLSGSDLLGDGQNPDYYKPLPRILQRG